MPLREALKEVNSMMPCDKIPCSKIADKRGVVRSTLTRTYRHETEPHTIKIINQQHLNTDQEAERVRYIDDPTERHLPPTRETI